MDKLQIVDDPFDQGEHKKLNVDEVSNVLQNGEGYFGVVRIIRNSLERDRGAGEH